MARMKASKLSNASIKPYGFIVGFGFVSMFMDVVYQAALSVQGPLLASFGASALLIGVISGLGEATSLVGRLFSGPLADRTGKYWVFAILGYAATGFAVPAMGFAGSLGAVAFLVIFERFGKSIRTPSRDAMLSNAASAVGRGKGFALHEVMDQIGAMGGPLIVAALLSLTHNDYRVALGVMIIPGIIAIIMLLVLRFRVPDPRVYEADAQTAALNQPEGVSIQKVTEGKTGTLTNSDGVLRKAKQEPEPELELEPEEQFTRREVAARLPRLFWLYTAACGIMLAGVATFGVISFHMVSTGIADDSLVPLVYAAAMGIDAVFAAVTGVLYDKIGTRTLLVLPFVCAAIPLFAYSSNLWIVLFGVLLWGVSLGIQESTMRAAVGDIVSKSQRASAYGFFSMVIGVGSLLGGVFAGALYDVGIPALVVYSFAAEVLAFVLLLKAVSPKRV